MRDADLAIGAPGMTSWERCCLGLPTIALVLAENQREVAEALARSGAAEVAAGVVDLPRVLASLIDDPDQRLAMTAAAAAIADGKGTERVITALATPRADVANAGQVRIRSATTADSEALWLWRNDPATREASRTQKPVPWPDHSAWLERTLAGADRHLLIAERNGHALGVVRFDRLPGAEPSHEVSINLRPDARGGSGTSSR